MSSPFVRMSLINCLVFLWRLSLSCLSINLSTYNSSDKDAPFITSLFETRLSVLDKHKTLVDLFYFNGATNMQKAGRILSVKYSHAVCLHGAEHVVSLFFSDLATMRPFKMSLLCSFCVSDINY